MNTQHYASLLTQRTAECNGETSVNRRELLTALSVGIVGRRVACAQTALRSIEQTSEVFVERSQSGQPHKGKMLAAIQPHNDDIPLFAAGTVIKLIREGYQGILIRVTNDEMAGRGTTMGEVVLNNEKDNFEVARLMGLTKVFDLHYRNHEMDAVAAAELRHRLIFLFRLMKVDTVLSYDPWGHYEENPDHYVTAKCVEAACWMSGGRLDLPEHFEAGLKPQSVQEKYYFSRGPQLINRVVDISSAMDQKVEVNRANVTQGPAGENGAMLRARLNKEGYRLPLLGNDDETANRQYIKHIVLRDDAELGKKYGVVFAEPFHYIGQAQSMLDEYIQKNRVPL
jgi:LmbE family N-acetylglucosaminyl deacetylase